MDGKMEEAWGGRWLCAHSAGGLGEGGCVSMTAGGGRACTASRCQSSSLLVHAYPLPSLPCEGAHLILEALSQGGQCGANLARLLNTGCGGGVGDAGLGAGAELMKLSARNRVRSATLLPMQCIIGNAAPAMLANAPAWREGNAAIHARAAPLYKSSSIIFYVLCSGRMLLAVCLIGRTPEALVWRDEQKRMLSACCSHCNTTIDVKRKTCACR